MSFWEKIALYFFIALVFSAIVGIFKLVVFLIKKLLPKSTGDDDYAYAQERAASLLEPNEKLLVIGKFPKALGLSIIVGIIAIGITIGSISLFFNMISVRSSTFGEQFGNIIFIILLFAIGLGLFYLAEYQLFGITKAYTYITNLRVVSERLIWGKKLKQIIIMKSDITKVSIVNTTLFLVTITRSIVIKTNKKSYSVMAENTEAVAKAIQE